MTSSWFFLSTLNYDARSTTHQIYCCVFVCSCCKEQTALRHPQRPVLRLGSWQLRASYLSGYSPHSEARRSALFSVALLRRSQPTDLTALLFTVFQVKTQSLRQVRVSYLAVLTSNSFNIPTLYPDIFKDLLVPRRKRLDM